MKADKHSLQEIFGNNAVQYEIPALQRRYVWTKKNWATMWETLLRFDEEFKSNPASSCFMGAVVLVLKSSNLRDSVQFVIDGQQRITTLAILLSVIEKAARQHGDDSNADHLNSLLVRVKREGWESCKIVMRNEDRNSLRAILSGEGSPSGGIKEARDYFSDRLRRHLATKGDGAGEWLTAFSETVLSGLRFVVITMDPQENAWGVFKSLNATGVALAPSDLVRNFVFEKCAGFEEQDAFDRDVWRPIEDRFKGKDASAASADFTAFIRNRLMAESGEHFKPADTYVEFETRYQTDSAQDIAGRLQEFLEPYLTAVAAISGGRLEGSTEAELLVSLQRLGDMRLGISVLPLIATILLKRKSGALSLVETVKCLSVLESFIVRRSVCGLPAKWFDKWFPQACKHVKSAATLREALSAEGRMPTDEEFLEALETNPLGKPKWCKYTNYILARIDGYLDPKDGYARVKSTVEHILPQSIKSKEWIDALDGPGDAHEWHPKLVNLLGNLALLPPGKNSSIQDGSFALKRSVYAGSKWEITRNVAGYQNWTRTEVQLRTKELARICLKLWP